ncbi:MAG TPA: hypothetical protein GXX72_02575, partial [Clostridiaceae bacterium]|nr:hypothetical protein [Clostridiaceae bacterium]
PGGLSEIAGLVHKGEWVAPAWQVKKYPHLIQMLENIRQRGYQSGGYTLDTGLHPISPPPAESPLSEKYLGEILDAVLYIEKGWGDFRMLEREIEIQTQVMLQEKAEAKKTPQNRIMELLFGKKDTTDLDWWVDFFDEGGFDGKAIVKETETALMGLTGGPVSIAQLSETFRIMVNEGIIPSGADLADAFGYWTKNLLKFAKAFEPIDKEFSERLGAGKERSEVSTIQEALRDPIQVQNAVAATMMMLEQTESTLAAQFAMAAGLIKGTGIELKLADEFKKIGLTNLPTDIISGLGQVLGGMSQNAEEAGSGMANIVLGLMSATGVGGPWAQILSPLIQTFFGQKKEKQKEAEKISQYRKFISSSDSGISMSDRFYLSGRHSALLRGETSGPYWGEGAVEQTFDKVEINVSGAGDPIAVAKEVKKALTSDIPRNYSRQVRRGLYR